MAKIAALHMSIFTLSIEKTRSEQSRVGTNTTSPLLRRKWDLEHTMKMEANQGKSAAQIAPK